MATKLLDLRHLREIRELVEKMTHSGETELNQNCLQSLINSCRLNSGYVLHTVNLLFDDLKEYHAEVRCGCIRLLNELFMNFEVAREEICDRLDVLMKLSMGVKSLTPLPPPLQAISVLKKLAIITFKNWNTHYGKDLVSVKLAYDYLQYAEHVDFNLLEVVDPVEKAKKEEAEKKQIALNKERLVKANEEMQDLAMDIENALMSLNTCFSMLVPDPSESSHDPSTSSEEPGQSEPIDMRVYGITDPNFKLNLDLKIGAIEIEENEENADILQSVNEFYKLIENKMLPRTKAWVEIIVKAEGEPELLKRALNQKTKLESAIAKYKMLVIKKAEREEEEEEEDVSSDSELEEVAADIVKKPHQVEFCFLDQVCNKVKSTKKIVEKRAQDAATPSTSGCSKIETKNSKGNSKSLSEKEERKKNLLKVAPKLPFDVDLYHWEDEKLPTPTIVSSGCEGHKFWASPNEDLSEIPVPGGASSLRSRVIEFTGEFKRVEEPCKAPLSSGALCMRYDRIKCPFHGIKVPRDAMGKIINPEDEAKVKKIQSVPDWQDPKLLADIKANIGLDLTMPEKGRGKHFRRRYPGLTDLKAKADTPMSRLAKKVFNRGSLKRVATMMDKLDHKRHRDKFGDQFNYTHDTS